MKKLIISFAYMAIVLGALNSIIPANYSLLPVIVVISFFTGFMPAFIAESLKDMQPAREHQPTIYQRLIIAPVAFFLLISLLPAKPQKEVRQLHSIQRSHTEIINITAKFQVKHHTHRQPVKQNFRVTKCDQGYYITGQTPNYFNSTF